MKEQLSAAEARATAELTAAEARAEKLEMAGAAREAERVAEIKAERERADKAIAAFESLAQQISPRSAGNLHRHLFRHWRQAEPRIRNHQPRHPYWEAGDAAWSSYHLNAP